MSTHAEVFVELSDGRVSGTYVHYDGYPRVCGVGLANHSYEAIKAAIGKAQRYGGFRFIGPDKIEGFDEGRRNCAISDLKDCRERYVYIKRLDGGVDAVIDGHRAPLFPAAKGPDVEEMTFLQLSDFLQTRCGSLCMDNMDDANKCASEIFAKFNVARK